MANPATIADAAYAAVLADANSDALRRLLMSDPSAALSGIGQALDDGAEWWQAVELTNLFSLDELEAADVGGQLVELRNQSVQRQESGAQALRELEERRQERRRAQAAETAARLAPDATGYAGTGPGALAALLARPRENGDPWILHDALSLAGQVQTLSDEEREDLRHRLGEWWPQTPLLETTVRHQGGGFTLPSEAAAWLWLGPVLNVAPTADQWAQLATSGVLGTSQSGWLRRHATQESVNAAVSLLDAPEIERWFQLLSTCPAPPPDDLITKLTDCAREPSSHAVHTEVAKALIEAGHVEAACKLAERLTGFARALRPLLAAQGDLDEQKALLDEMLDALRHKNRVRRDDAAWMHGISDDSLLPRLAEILRLALALARPADGDEDDLGWYQFDIVNPTVNAIIAIGGERAVAALDELLDEDPRFRWMRNQRDKIAESLLRMDGLEAAPAAAHAAGVPALSGPE